MRQEVLIEAAGVRLGYPGFALVDGLTLEIRRGDLWCLLGANGSGKTTFLRAVLGLVPVRGGRLHVAPDLDPGTVGFVAQHCQWRRTVPSTVREFVSLGMVGQRLSRAERNARLTRALATVALEAHALSDLWSLSGGQRQRAMIGRALIREPSLLLLDEPTASLDPAAEDALLELVSRVHREAGVTVLLVTHDLTVAERFATHVALFHDGAVEAGSRAEVLQRDNLERIYGRASHGWLHALGECPP